MHIPKKLFKSLRETHRQDKIDEFKQEGLFQRVSKIHISRTPNEIREMDFADGGDGGNYASRTGPLPIYSRRLLLRGRKDKKTNYGSGRYVRKLFIHISQHVFRMRKRR